MRLLHILPSFAPGGSQSRVATLISRLGNSFAHTIVAIDGDFSALSRVGSHASVDWLPFKLTASGTLHMGNLLRLRQLLRTQRPDVLVTYNWGTIEMALANRIRPICPHLHCEDGFSGSAAAAGEPRRRHLLRRLVLGPSSRLVVPSRTLLDVATRVWRIPQERVHYLPNGVDTDRFHPAAVRHGQSATGLNGTVTIGTLCRLSAEKNIPRLLRAFAPLASAGSIRLVIAGEGPERDKLRRLRSSLELEDTVDLPGETDDAPGFLRGIDIFALSSDSEQMPYGILEAMACGLPIIATDVGDVHSMLSEANRGFVVPAADADAFADGIARLVQSPDLRREIGAANRHHVCNEFDAATMIARYRNLLLETAGIGDADVAG
jgi:glycosyltransferase involved in cell wall biosynthesis